MFEVMVLVRYFPGKLVQSRGRSCASLGKGVSKCHVLVEEDPLFLALVPTLTRSCVS